MKRIEVIIDVKQEHIENGIRESCVSSPIGLSLLDDGFNNVMVEDAIILECDGITYEYYYELDGDIRQFIRDFDKGLKVYPFKTEPLDFIEDDLSYKSSEDI